MLSIYYDWPDQSRFEDWRSDSKRGNESDDKTTNNKQGGVQESTWIQWRTRSKYINRQGQSGSEFEVNEISNSVWVIDRDGDSMWSKTGKAVDRVKGEREKPALWKQYNKVMRWLDFNWFRVRSQSNDKSTSKSDSSNACNRIPKEFLKGKKGHLTWQHTPSLDEKMMIVMSKKKMKWMMK